MRNENRLTLPAYHITNLKHRYAPGHTALSVEALSIQKSSITGLMGPNGSGKTTLLKLMAFIEKPSEGRIQFFGKPAAPFSAHVRFRATLLTQEAYLMKRTVYANIAYGLKIRGDTTDVRQRISEALAMVGLEYDAFARRQWDALSGGEAQRVAMAARLVLKPDVLLLDEPTAGVDAASVPLIREAALRARNEWGATLIIAGHDRDWLYDVCDNMLHMFRGRILGESGENIIFGPWIQTGNRFWEKPLHDGQIMIVAGGPDDNAAAVIDSKAFSVHPPGHETAPPRHSLKGTIIRLMLETGGTGMIAAIRVGGMTFNVRLTAAEMQGSGLYPGQDVCLSYDPSSVTWIDSSS